MLDVAMQVEDKELDADKVHTAMAGLLASQKADREAQRLRCDCKTRCSSSAVMSL